jgi:phosphoribosylanthranilate isomerase
MNLTRTRIKMCGLTRADDILHALHLGVDALGFVFYRPSKRYISPVQANQLTQNVPAFVSTVALFVDPSPSEVREVIQAIRPSILQFHGNETQDFCASFGLPYIKAFRVGAPELDTPERLAKFCTGYSDAAGWLFDSYTAAYGGSGQSFDYALLSRVLAPDFYPRSLILSGGLHAQNVAKALEQTHPWAVDVSSGVEDAPGLKSHKKMSDFVAAIWQSDSNRCVAKVVLT